MQSRLLLDDARDGAQHHPPLRYDVDWTQLGAAAEPLRATFVQSHADAETTAWIHRSATGVSTWRRMASDALTQLVGRTTANGVTWRGGMFVVSRAAVSRLLERARGATPAAAYADTDADRARVAALIAGEAGASAGLRHARLRLLDIGAGDGDVTAVLAPLFDSVDATEDNAVMRLRLRLALGASASIFSSAETSAAALSGATGTYYSMVALLNVLDRCDKPATLLREIRAHLVASAAATEAKAPPLLLLACVLPFCPFVEDGAVQRAPTEELSMGGGGLCRERSSFERSLAKLVLSVLEPLGFRVRAWTRLPYLSQGDGAASAYFALDDAVLLLSAE
jgi:hypothetical protein